MISDKVVLSRLLSGLGTAAVLLLAMGSISYAGSDRQYCVSAIPEKLKKDGGAVVRCDEGIFRVKSIKKAVLTSKKAVTIFKKRTRNTDGKYYSMTNSGI